MNKSHIINPDTIKAEFEAFKEIEAEALTQAFYFFNIGTPAQEVKDWIQDNTERSRGTFRPDLEEVQQ